MRPPTHSSTRQAPSHALQGDRPGTLRAVHVLGARRKCPRGRKGTEGPPRGGRASQGRASGLSARKPAGVRSCHSRWGTRVRRGPPALGGSPVLAPARSAAPPSGFLPRHRRTRRPSRGLRSGRCAGQTPNSPPACLPRDHGWVLVTRVHRLHLEHTTSQLKPTFKVILRSQLPETGQRWTPTPAPSLLGCPPTPAASAREFL